MAFPTETAANVLLERIASTEYAAPQTATIESVVMMAADEAAGYASMGTPAQKTGLAVHPSIAKTRNAEKMKTAAPVGHVAKTEHAWRAPVNARPIVLRSPAEPMDVVEPVAVVQTA